MTIHIYSNLRTSLVRLALLTVSLGTMQASAQAPATAPAQPGLAAMAETGPPGYRSALEGYLPYKDEKIVNWKEANDIAGQIGGWRAYAKEASQGQSPDNAAKPASSTAPAKP